MDDAALIERLCRSAGLPTRGVRVTPLRRGASGSRVFEVALRQRRLVAKLGAPAKIDAEAEACRRWQELRPGAARAILSLESEGERRALLGDYLEGVTIGELWERDGLAAALPAVEALAATLRAIWDGTARPQAAPAVYADDIATRLYALLEARPALAPILERPVGGASSGRALLWRLSEAQQKLMPGFSVTTHGDLTPDNVLFDARTGRVAFLDLARSVAGDYLLDVGKFVAAEVRRSQAVRPRLSTSLVAAARAFARARRDRTFAPRLQVSCARTLLGSARLVDDSRARWQIEAGLAMLARALPEGRAR